MLRQNMRLVRSFRFLTEAATEFHSLQIVHMCGGLQLTIAWVKYSKKPSFMLEPSFNHYYATFMQRERERERARMA